MRVLVCGGRNYQDYPRLERELDLLKPSTIIHGMATGADSLADEYAERKSIKVIRFKADWNNLGTKAGPIRNKRMLDEGKPDLVIAFPGGRGAADMVKRARKAGIPVNEIK